MVFPTFLVWNEVRQKSIFIGGCNQTTPMMYSSSIVYQNDTSCVLRGYYHNNFQTHSSVCSQYPNKKSGWFMGTVLQHVRRMGIRTAGKASLPRISDLAIAKSSYGSSSLSKSTWNFRLPHPDSNSQGVPLRLRMTLRTSLGGGGLSSSDRLECDTVTFSWGLANTS